MATKFLDYTGLSYFCNKIKAWCNATFAAITHNQASNTINAMTGYSKPSSSSAITTSDTLNSAIGKLEKGLENADTTNAVLKNTSNQVTVKEFLFRNVDNDALRIGGGSGRAKGANILLYGKDNVNSGRVDFQAYDGTNYSTLKFEPTETRPVFYWLNGYGSGSEQIAYLTDLSGYVPSTRTINGKALSSNISLTASDVGAAASSHNQASNTITTMTGYSKPSSTSAISTSDTLNQAIGKLEKSIDDADISNVVHRTGAESIAGVKTFTDILHATNSDADSSAIRIHCDALDVASLPSSDKYANIHFLDVNGIQLGRLLLYKNTGGQTGMSISVKQHNSSSGQTSYDASLSVRVGSDGSGLALCPTPPSDSNINAIATTEWVRNKNYALDSSVVHTTGNEDISGVKNFSNSIYEHYGYYLYNDSLEYNKLPSETKYSGFVIRDKNDQALGRVLYSKSSSGICRLQLNVGSHGYADLESSGYLGIVTDPDYNTAYAMAPTFEQWDSNGDVVATTYWVRHATGNTSLNAASATELKTARAFRVHLDSTSTDSFDGTANCTPGVTGVLGVSNGGTGLSSLSTFVRTTGAQTVAGTKTFSDTVVFSSASIKNADDAHAFYVCGGGGNTATNGAYMILCGSGWSANPGKFYLRATTTSSNTRTLLGTPGGNLTWNGAVIQTSSDARLKTPMSDVPDDALDAWEDVRWGRFKMLDAIEEKGAEKARFHIGLIAQQAKDAFETHGLDGCIYGILCYDDNDFDDLWMVRYTEALCMEAAYQRRKNKILENRISELEKQVSDMLQILQSLKGAN